MELLYTNRSPSTKIYPYNIVRAVEDVSIYSSKYVILKKSRFLNVENINRILVAIFMYECVTEGFNLTWFRSRISYYVTRFITFMDLDVASGNIALTLSLFVNSLITFALFFNGKTE